MIEQFVSSFVSVLIRNGKCKEQDKQIVIYGLITCIEIMLNVITTAIIGLFFNMFLESLLFLFGFSFLRTYTGGYHANKFSMCYLFSTVILIITLIVSKLLIYIEFIELYLLIFIVISVFIIVKYSPVDSNNKILDPKEKIVFKRRTLINLIIELILIGVLILFNYKNLAIILVISMCVLSILIVLGKRDKKEKKNLFENKKRDI